MQIKLTINGSPTTVDVEPNVLLVDLLRDTLGLTGTHVGCDTSQCGACTVLVDGEAVKSCSMLAVSADGRGVTTVEGLAMGRDGLHPMQQAFHENHGLQCGFCTPGMLMIGVDIARRNSKPTEAEVRHGLDGNLCRCTGYQNIVKSIIAGAAMMRAENQEA